MLKRFFKRKDLPQKDGKSDSKTLEKLNFVKKYELQLSNMEEAPLYALTHQLTIGSEIGNIVISDSSISPRHASFILQDEVVSLIDHGSIAGTFVNGKKITPGKYIILSEEDIVMIGELEVRLISSRVAAPKENIPEVPEERNEIAIDIPEVPKVAHSSSPAPEPKKKFDPKEHLKTNSKKKKKIAYADERSAANTAIRVVAIGVDLLITYILLIVLAPFDDFKNFLREGQSIGTELFLTAWSELKPFLSDFGFVEEMLKDFYSFASSSLHFEPVLLVFFIFRFVTTLSFGVSAGQFLVGLRGGKSFLWNRVGGGFRVLLGGILGPFLIFDIPAIISRRTLKEMLSFTRVINPSKLRSILLSILVPVILLTLALVSPLFQGLELTEPVLVNNKIDKRIKVQNLDEENPVALKQEVSETLHLELNYNPDDIFVIPSFSFQGENKKLSLKSNLTFFQQEFERGIHFEVLKKFDLKQLIEVGLKSDPFLKDKFPELAGFVFTTAQVNPNFKKVITEKDIEIFGREFINFTQLALTLSAENFLNVLENETYLLNGLVDYKTTLLALIEYKDFDDVGYVQIGNGTFMRFVFSEKQRPFDLLIPVFPGEGQIYKVTWDKKEKYESSRNKFYKYNLNGLNVIPKKADSSKTELNALKIFDLFSREDFKTELSDPELAQSLYGYYFEGSTAVLKRNDGELLEIWRSKVSNLLKVLESISSQGDTNLKTKLIHNFKDLNDALLNKNYEYFGISQNVTI